MQGTATVNMYEYMGEPIKQCVDAWLNAVRDPMTDPKWRRKQRLKRIWRRVVSIFKIAVTATVIWVILRSVIRTSHRK